MKLLIGGIIALLCVQTIYSLSSWSQCDKDLFNRKKDIGQFLNEFEKHHKKSREQYLALKDVCSTINYKFNKLSDDGCLQNPRATDCRIDNFLDTFFQLRIKAMEHLTKLIYEAAIEFNMADEFKCENKFDCIFDETATLCEKKTNALNCNVVKFVFYMRNEHAFARNNIVQLLSLLNELDEVTRQFSCEYNPICKGGNCSGETDKNSESLSAAFEEFHTVFGSLLDKVRKGVSGIGQASDAIKEEINDWKKIRVSTE